MSKRLTILIFIWLILVLMTTSWVSVNSWLKASEPNREPVLYQPKRKSINYEVFKPALFLAEDVYFLFDNWIDFFKPSHLRQWRCEVAPASPDGIPFTWIRKGFEACYQEAGPAGTVVNED